MTDLQKTKGEVVLQVFKNRRSETSEKIRKGEMADYQEDDKFAIYPLK